MIRTMLKSITGVMLFFWTLPVLASQPQSWEIKFQHASTPVMERIDSLHDLVLIIISLIAILVFGLLAYIIFRFNSKRNPTPSKRSHHTILEFIWTAIPVVILLVIAVPSLKLIFYMDKATD